MTDTQIDPDYKLALWDRVQETDPNFTKDFKKQGGFKGTAINATYLARRATEEFGPIGIGWGVQIVDESILQGHDETKVHRLQVRLWYKLGEQVGEVFHFGQTTFVGRNSNGWYTDEDAPKKSLTDATTKCLSLLGFASDVHLGLYDDNGYVNDLRSAYGEDDKFTRRGVSTGSRRDDGPDDMDQTEREPAKDKSGKMGQKPSSRSKDEPQNDLNADDGGDTPMPDDELVEALKQDIRSKKSHLAVSDYMTHKDTVRELASLPTELSQQVRQFAIKFMKDTWDWPNNVQTNSSRKKAEKAKAKAPTEDEVNDAVSDAEAAAGDTGENVD